MDKNKLNFQLLYFKATTHLLLVTNQLKVPTNSENTICKATNCAHFSSDMLPVPLFLKTEHKTDVSGSIQHQNVRSAKEQLQHKMHTSALLQTKPSHICLFARKMKTEFSYQHDRLADRILSFATSIGSSSAHRNGEVEPTSPVHQKVLKKQNIEW